MRLFFGSALSGVFVQQSRKRFFRLGANAEVGVGLGEENLPVFCDHIGCWQGSRQLGSPFIKGTLTMIER
jgi:hypothetical protein